MGYMATTIGYLIVSRPFMDMNNERFKNATQPELLEDYYRSGRMLVRLSQAIGRIVLAGREMSRLAGFTARVTELMKVTDELNKGIYERTMVQKINSSTDMADEENLPLVPCNNVSLEDFLIEFEKVPLVTPNGDVLVREINFKVPSGRNVVICGPNGCGKSSLLEFLVSYGRCLVAV